LNAKSSSRRDRRRRSLAFCSLSFRGGSSFSRSHHARGDLTLSFPRGVSKRNDSRRFEIPRHDHCAQKPPPPRHDDGEKKRKGVLRPKSANDDESETILQTSSSSSSSNNAKVGARFQRIISRRISTTGRDKNREERKNHTNCASSTHPLSRLSARRTCPRVGCFCAIGARSRDSRWLPPRPRRSASGSTRGDRSMTTMMIAGRPSWRRHDASHATHS